MQMTNQKTYRIIGMMSGTSLDGVDLSFCQYQFKEKWNYRLIAAKTYPYTSNIIDSINIMQNPSTTFLAFKKEELNYTEYIASLILSFIQQQSLTNIDYISLHGHTIFHHPQQRITVQIANLPLVAAKTRIDVIGNFRQVDVMREGEGAPLAPFGEELFEGDIFINLGGVANIGCCRHGWDINFCNMFFNYFAKQIEDREYDQEGSIGKKGSLNMEVYRYFVANWSKSEQKSLEREQFEYLLKELKERFAYVNATDLLTTFYNFLGDEIVKSINKISKKMRLLPKRKIEVVCSGGGANNTFLIDLVKMKLQSLQFQIKVGSKEIVEFKEAIIFGLLGVKFLEGIQNCSKGIGGMLVKGKKNS